MFTIPPLPTTFSFQPPFPSPLSPRSVNVFTMPRKKNLQSPQSKSSFSPAPLSPPITPPSVRKSDQVPQQPQPLDDNQPRTPLRSVPLHRTPPVRFGADGEAQRRRRREQYLNQVQRQREEKRWNVKGDQILQHDFVAEQRAWEAERARSAPVLDPDFVADEAASSKLGHLTSAQGADLASSLQQGALGQTDTLGDEQVVGSQGQQDEMYAWLEAEEQELDALVAMHEQMQTDPKEDSISTSQDMWSGMPQVETMSTSNASDPATGWGSDDEEFEEMLWKVSEAGGGVDAMDTSGA